MDIDTEKEAYIRASSHLLSEKFPSDYENMTDSQLRDYCAEKSIIPSYSPTETLAKIDELAVDFVAFQMLVESSKLQDVCKEYLARMVESKICTEEESSQFYDEFCVCEKEEGGQKAFEKLTAHIENPSPSGVQNL